MIADIPHINPRFEFPLINDQSLSALQPCVNCS